MDERPAWTQNPTTGLWLTRFGTGLVTIYVNRGEAGKPGEYRYNGAPVTPSAGDWYYGPIRPSEQPPSQKLRQEPSLFDEFVAHWVDEEGVETPRDLRPVLAHFAALMEVVLRLHDEQKGGWRDADPTWLAAKLQEECGEVARELISLYSPHGGQQIHINLSMAFQAVRECIDVANVAMMLADRMMVEVSR